MDLFLLELKMREIKKIIVHCSMSDFGDAETIDRWHRERGFRCIGYHYVILNGCRKKGHYNDKDDGVLEIGRPLEEIGAHCRGHNHDSVGICLIGNHHFSIKQLKRLIQLISFLRQDSRIGNVPVFGHRDFNPHKTCPNFDIQDLNLIFKENRY